jgi:hypothetical protein
MPLAGLLRVSVPSTPPKRNQPLEKDKPMSWYALTLFVCLLPLLVAAIARRADVDCLQGQRCRK